MDSHREILVALKEKRISTDAARKKIQALSHNSNTSGYPSLLEPIAVIGMSGRFPGASSINEFWSNLQQGVDSIQEIPKQRWDVDQYFDPEPGKPGKIYSRYAGFINGVEEFDPLFFSISPQHAQQMDPQYRLLLQEIWRSLEDAGCRASDLSRKNVGLFVAGSIGDYPGGSVQLPSTESSRIAYLFDWKGPCICIETTCSSGLVALHEACLHLRTQQAQMAVVGGVNLMTTPEAYLGFSQLYALSAKGRCFSFDQRADGTVFSEGVCALVLKPLSAAQLQNHHIYGVIKGSGINYDGKTNGITAPSGKAQTDIEVEVYKKYNINPEQITLVEAHGTGTTLGDPIEVNALTKAYRHFTNKTGYCALGSVKSNVGHAGICAGLVGLIKVLLSLEHQKIPPTVNFQTINPKIAINDSPFYINTQLIPWETENTPRIATVSAFGFSGTNAHVVVEEYQQPRQVEDDQAALIVLSAKSEPQLRQIANNLRAYLLTSQHRVQSSLRDIAYTLQVGREAMEERLALLVESTSALDQKLEQYLCNAGEIENLYQGRATDNKNGLAQFDSANKVQHILDSWLKQKQYGKILGLWVKGLTINWDKLYGEYKPHRISLPTYPFARETHWLDNIQYTGVRSRQADSVNKNTNPISNAVKGFIHPLVHQNVSTLSEQRFYALFTGAEFFLRDHQVGGKKLLPGVAYLEMVRSAVVSSMTDSFDAIQIQLKNSIWAAPIVVDKEPVKVFIRLEPETDEHINYHIYTQQPGSSAPTTHSQGTVVCRAGGQRDLKTANDSKNPTDNTVVDLTTLQSKLTKQISAKQCYDVFQAGGIDYGLAHQAIEALYIGAQQHVGEPQVLAKLSLPSVVADTLDEFILHPSMMDSALQASLGLKGEAIFLSDALSNEPLLPFALEQLDIVDRCHSTMWAWIRLADADASPDNIQKLDIDLYDNNARLCVRLRGFSSRVLQKSETVHSSASASDDSVLILKPYWQNDVEPVTDIDTLLVDNTAEKHITFVCEMDSIYQALKEKLPNHRVYKLDHTVGAPEHSFVNAASALFLQVRDILQQKPVLPIFIQLLVRDANKNSFDSALLALLKTAHLENPNITGQVIAMDDHLLGDNTDSAVDNILQQNTRCPDSSLIRYVNGNRSVLRFDKIEQNININSDTPWREGGVYLITGGMGGLGLIFAKTIAQHTENATLILTGRSPINEQHQQTLALLQSAAVRAHYHPVDVTDEPAVQKLINDIKHRYGFLTGIIHSAGLIRDNYIVKKSEDEFLSVLAPKVVGTTYLDRASQDLKLDLFVLFSSGTGVMGSVGQADYATANAFMDTYAHYRNTLVSQGQRHGKTLSINWPLWRDGGMGVDETTEQLMSQTTGLVAMPTEQGVQALQQCLCSGETQTMVLAGDQAQMITWLQNSGVLSSSANINVADTTSMLVDVNTQVDDAIDWPEHDDNDFTENITNFLKKELAEVLKLPAHQLQAQQPMEKYGIDSIVVMKLTNKLEQSFGSLPKTLFFEYQTLAEVSRYFAEAHRPQLLKLLTQAAPSSVKASGKSIKTKIINSTASSANKNVLTQKNGNTYRFKAKSDRAVSIGPVTKDIAIVALSGRYPQCKNLDVFWQNLKAGKDCVTTVPVSRWDWRDYYNDDRTSQSGHYCKWGGFIEGVDLFDPLFFNISPNEATIIDPNERLFLEEVWCLLEQAGYTKQSLKNDYHNKVGVYVGVMYQHYRSPASSYASIANRISHYFDCQGPSIAIDTMCSSSTVAVHMACDSLIKDECKLAIAGGVNLSLRAEKYSHLCQGQIVGSHSDSRSFSDGDGYLPAEAVGAVLLKPVASAVADNDTILAVIKSSAINHGGHTHGFTVPNPKAQAQLILDNFKQSGIDPRTVSYVEAAANGGSLGDPVELSALNNVFKQSTSDQPLCAIGSVKSNIGHAEAASGMSQLTKVVLQLQHRQLVPSIKAEPLNPNLSFDNTAFYLQKDLQEWTRPTLNVNGKTREYPRRATVSSFGATGTNAHLIVEEYAVSENEGFCTDPTDVGSAQLIILSAKNEDRLQLMAERLHHYVETHTDLSLLQVAYTLQTGREAMECRLTMIVNDQQALLDALKGYVDLNSQQTDVTLPESVMTTNLNDERSLSQDLLSGKTGQLVLQSLLEERNLEKLALYWLQGGEIPWESLHDGKRLQKCVLPSYPFEKKRYWYNPSSHRSGGVEDVNAAQPHSLTTNKMVAPCNTIPAMENGITKQVLVSIEAVLGVPATQISLNKPLIDYGMSSIHLIQLYQSLEKQYGETMDQLGWQQLATAQAMIDYLVVSQKSNIELKNSTTTVNTTTTKVNSCDSADIAPWVVDANAELPLRALDGLPVAYERSGAGVFLTGVTGFVGIHLLNELVCCDNNKIFCLIRAKSAKDAKQRIVSSMGTYGLNIRLDKVIPIVGDLNKPRFGVSDTSWQELSNSVGRIIHSAASVNHILPYAAMRESFLPGIHNIIELASNEQIKSIHYLSSVASCMQIDAQGTMSLRSDEAIPANGQHIFGGYGQSKWVQESLIQRASQRGITFCIHRFGEISGSSLTGLGQWDDMMHRLINMILASGAWSSQSPLVMDMIPVDYAAKFVVGVLNDSTQQNRVYHATHPSPLTLTHFFDYATEHAISLKQQSKKECINQCVAYSKTLTNDNKVIIDAMLSPLKQNDGSMFELYFMPISIKQGNFTAALHRLGLTLPPWPTLWRTYFKVWKRAGPPFNLLWAKSDNKPVTENSVENTLLEKTDEETVV